MLDFQLRDMVERTLTEDMGQVGDVTTMATVGPKIKGKGSIVAREGLVVSGLAVARMTFLVVDPTVKFEAVAKDGARLAKGDVIATLSGSLRSILIAERPALNFLGRLSGIATNTHAFVEAVTGLTAKVVDTRKTTPLHRALEKAAIRHGGAHNHRFNLTDGILIKDNHVIACGGVEQAVAEAKKNLPHHLIKIGVEVDRIDQIEPALAAGAEHLLLDNMAPTTLKKAVALVDGRATTEASGGVRLNTVRGIAETGVDFISSGSLIHAARWVDVALDFDTSL